MTSFALTPLLIALLPTLVFLGALVFFDSYKLVSLRLVLATIVIGGLCAAGCRGRDGNFIAGTASGRM